MGGSNQVTNLRRLQSLWRQIQQIQRPFRQGPTHLLTHLRRKTGMETGRGDLALAQLANLILHQGHQGRNHQHQPFFHQGWKLIAE